MSDELDTRESREIIRLQRAEIEALRAEAERLARGRYRARTMLEASNREVLTMRPVVEAAERAERLMHSFLDALESDASLEDKRKAFEGIQDYFEPREMGGGSWALAAYRARTTRTERSPSITRVSDCPECNATPCRCAQTTMTAARESAFKNLERVQAALDADRKREEP